MMQRRDNLAHVEHLAAAPPSRQEMLRLDGEQCGLPLDAALAEALRAHIVPQALTQHADAGPLYAKLSRRFSLPERCLLITAGSDSAVKVVCDSLLRRGVAAVITDPCSAAIARHTAAAEARVTKVPYHGDFTLPLGDLLDALTPCTRLVMLSHPHQPSGHAYGAADFHRLLDCCEQNGTVLCLDEAYVDFLGDSRLTCVRQSEHLAVVRSFSQSYGLPGLQLGFIAAQPPLIELFRGVRPEASINQLTLNAGCWLLEHPQVLQQRLRAVDHAARWLEASLRSMGLRCHRGPGNFLLVDVRRPTRPVLEALERRRILVADASTLPMPGQWLRVTIGAEEPMRTFASALHQVLDQQRRTAA